jgi:hypothetical protein
LNHNTFFLSLRLQQSIAKQLIPAAFIGEHDALPQIIAKFAGSSVCAHHESSLTERCRLCFLGVVVASHGFASTRRGASIPAEIVKSVQREMLLHRLLKHRPEGKKPNPAR